jgi:hypothetical protein
MSLIAGTAYSYVRFSSRKQERGASVHRQESLRDVWLVRLSGPDRNVRLLGWLT